MGELYFEKPFHHWHLGSKFHILKKQQRWRQTRCIYAKKTTTHHYFRLGFVSESLWTVSIWPQKLLNKFRECVFCMKIFFITVRKRSILHNFTFFSLSPFKHHMKNHIYVAVKWAQKVSALLNFHILRSRLIQNCSFCCTDEIVIQIIKNRNNKARIRQNSIVHFKANVQVLTFIKI